MISVIVPVFNGAHVLDWSAPAVKALEGVSETIYVDDGSTDGTPERLEALDMRVVRLSENRGRAGARNAGAAATTGEVLVFLDADVHPPPDLAVRFAAALVGPPPGAVATVARLTFDGLRDDPYHDYLRSHPRGPAEVAPGTSIAWKHFVTTACAVSRVAFDAAGGFDASIAYGEDLALACALASDAPRGLVASGVTAAMTDAGTLETALDKIAAFGRALPALARSCPDVYRLAGLERLVAPSLALRVAGSAPVARLVRRVLPMLPPEGRVRAVRYLLGQSLLNPDAVHAPAGR